MLPRKNRLSRKDFNRFFAIGRRLQSHSFQMVSVPHDSFHASIVVPKKTAPRAVDRNRLRRRIYDIVRRHKGEAHGVFIFITKQAALRETHAKLRSEVENAMLKTTDL